MKKETGLWIDRRKAIIVTLSDGTEDIRIVESNVDRRVRRAGGSRSRSPFGPQEIMAERKRENEFADQLARYYSEVVACLRDAQSIVILGPGEARIELKKCLERERLGERVVCVEAADKMTDRQIVARIRQHFHNRRQTA